MATIQIQNLPPASTPLNASDIVPVVQSNITTSATLADVWTIPTDSVLASNAGATAGAIGAYSLLYTSGSSLAPGDTTSGASLYYSSAAGAVVYGQPSGTWRCMGGVVAAGATARTSLFLRIA